MQSFIHTVTVSFDSSDYNVNEATGSVQLTIVLNQLSSQRFNVRILTMDGTATGIDIAFLVYYLLLT